MSATHLDAERMAELAGSGTAPSPAEAAHLAGCADCRFERAMLSTARRLGADRLAGFDPDRVAMRVRARLAGEAQEPPTPRVRHPGRWLAGLAAAAVVVFAVRMGVPRNPETSGGGADRGPATASVLYELDGLSEPQLEEVLESIPPAGEALDHLEMASLDDLDADDLERVLQSMEEP